MDLLFTGDVILTRGMNRNLKVFGDSLVIKSFKNFGKHDFIIINLETTLTNSGPKQKRKYNLKADASRAIILKKSGVTHVSIANNHIFDYGKKGYLNTIKALKSNNLEILGNSKKPVIIHKGKSRVAVLSACMTTYNDSLPISSVQELKKSIKRFKYWHKHIPLVVYLHWGLEYQRVPQQWQRKLAKELIIDGADAIIGHHPHVSQTIEFINGKPVIYSLGNFIADTHIPITRIAYTADLKLKDSIQSISITPYKFNKFVAHQLTPENQIKILKKLLTYSNIVLYRAKNKWNIKTIKKLNFSEPVGLWLVAEQGNFALIKKIKPNLFFVNIQTPDIQSKYIRLPGKVSEIRIADINNDNKIDVLILVCKKVIFDNKCKKRLQVYTIRGKNLVPLWLGTKFVDNLKSFDIIKKNGLNYLATTEIYNNKKIKRIYEWDGFGFALTNLK
jgi:poly-gamma-glutamate synthesis protein (capsule biosynthesis protein)